MKKEIEIRIRIDEKIKKTILKFVEVKKIQLQSSHQVDQYFCEKVYIDNQNTKDTPYVIRVRTSNKGHTLVYKSFVSNKTSWTEEETKIDDPNSMINILNHLGYFEYLNIEKYRETGKYQNIEFNIDKIINLGTFLELEIIMEDIDVGKSILYDFSRQFGIKDTEIVDKGYVQLMEEKSND